MRIHPLVVASLMIGGCGADGPTVEIVQRHFTLPTPAAMISKAGVGIPSPFEVIAALLLSIDRSVRGIYDSFSVAISRLGGPRNRTPVTSA